jgi:hypothetical protein
MKLPSHFWQKLLTFEKYVIQLQKENNYLLSHTGNASEMLLYFNILSSSTIKDVGAKSVVTESSGIEKMLGTPMVMELTNSMKLLPYVVRNRKIT